jgi:hypothetical protein
MPFVRSLFVSSALSFTSSIGSFAMLLAVRLASSMVKPGRDMLEEDEPKRRKPGPRPGFPRFPSDSPTIRYGHTRDQKRQTMGFFVVLNIFRESVAEKSRSWPRQRAQRMTHL